MMIFKKSMTGSDEKKTTADYLHMIDDLVKENAALRVQRNEYASSVVSLQDKLQEKG